MIAPSTDDLLDISKRFKREMALNGRGSLRMINSHFGRPSGVESGDYIAVDFGGTNVRIAVVSIRDGVFEVGEPIKFSLAECGFDYSSGVTTADELFSLIALKMRSLGFSSNEKIRLGHTFSFPCRHDSAGEAVLLHWTKELNISGCVGQDINKILKGQLDRHRLSNVVPVAILNDTIAALLSAAYTDRDVSIGSICGTGHNSAYFDPSLGRAINIEAGNFDKIPPTFMDTTLDAESREPGSQLLEKMTSGRYLGELYRIGAHHIFGEIHAPYSISAVDVENIIGSADSEHAELAKDIVKRAAGFIAASYYAMLCKIDDNFSRRHVISVDGSLYTRFAYFRTELHAALNALLGENANSVSVKNFEDGSLTGAAVAAALVSQ